MFFTYMKWKKKLNSVDKPYIRVLEKQKRKLTRLFGVRSVVAEVGNGPIQGWRRHCVDAEPFQPERTKREQIGCEIERWSEVERGRLAPFDPPATPLTPICLI